MKARRLGTLRLDEAERWTRLPSGAVVYRAAKVARCGVQVYRRGDGTECREFRPPTEVFDEAALRSLSLRPIVIDHTDEVPPPPDRVVGATGTARRDGDWVVADLMFTDWRAVEEIRSGRRAELSAGYVADVVDERGVWNGERYDAVQRRPRGLHVALVDRGRAGPETRLRLDGDAILIDSKGDDTMTEKQKQARRDEIEAAVERSKAGMNARICDANPRNRRLVADAVTDPEEAHRKCEERAASHNVKGLRR